MLTTGKVIHKELQSGLSRAGREWRNMILVIEFQEGTRSKNLAFNLFGDERIANNPFEKGQVVAVHYDVESSEYNGRWFTQCSAWKVEPVDQNQMAPMNEQEDENYGLPF